MDFMGFLIIKILRRLERRCRRAALSVSCTCLVFSGFSEKSSPLSVCYSNSAWYLSVRILSISILSTVRIFKASDFVGLDFFCLDSVWAFRKTVFCCLLVRSDKKETEVSALSVSLSAAVDWKVTWT